MTTGVFRGEQLALARQRRLLSKVDCARALNISIRTLANYESNRSAPTAAALTHIAEQLDFRESFFFMDSAGLPAPAVASFRALARMSARVRDSALAAASLGLELQKWIGRKFDLPTPNLPDLGGAEPELAAAHVRTAWDIQANTAPNIIHLLESKGVRVLALPLTIADADGLSLWHEGIPFAFLNTTKSGERSRFDAAHELGHLILHRQGSPAGRDAEAEANLFASAFLMPEEPIRRFVGHRQVSMSLVLSIKQEFRVSAMSLVFRLERLRIISQWAARSLFQQLSSQGFRSAEPGGIPREGSQLLSKVIAILNAEGVRYSTIAEELGWSNHELFGLLEGLVVVPTTTTRVDGRMALRTMSAVDKPVGLRLVR